MTGALPFNLPPQHPGKHSNADFDSIPHVSYFPAWKRHWYDDTIKFLTSSVFGLPLHTQNQVLPLVSHSATILDKCML